MNSLPGYIYESSDEWGGAAVYADYDAMKKHIASLSAAGPKWEDIDITDCQEWVLWHVLWNGAPLYRTEGYIKDVLATFKHIGDGRYELGTTYTSVEEAESASSGFPGVKACVYVVYRRIDDDEGGYMWVVHETYTGEDVPDYVYRSLKRHPNTLRLVRYDIAA